MVIENAASVQPDRHRLSIDDAGERNVISGNNNFGVELSGNGTSGNVVQGNVIGTDLTGTLPSASRATAFSSLKGPLPTGSV